MATAIKRISDGKIVIECSEKEAAFLFSAIKIQKYHYQGSWDTETWMAYCRLVDDLSPIPITVKLTS